MTDDQLWDQIQRLTQRVDLIGDELNEVKIAVARLEERFDAMGQRFDGMEERFDAVERHFDRLEQSIDKRFDAVGARFDQIDARFDRMNLTLVSGLFVLLGAMVGLQLYL